MKAGDVANEYLTDLEPYLTSTTLSADLVATDLVNACRLVQDSLITMRSRLVNGATYLILLNAFSKHGRVTVRTIACYCGVP